MIASTAQHGAEHQADHARSGVLRWIAARLSAARGSSEGFSLIEVVVAMAVLAITAMAVLTVLLNGVGVSKSARQRVAASNLASREIEIVRNQFNTSSSDALAVAAAGTQTNANPIAGPGPSVVDGVPYTVTREVQWLPVGNGASACDGGSLISYPSLRVQVRVTWPDMRTALPVRSDTLLTPSKDTLGGSVLSFVAVKVKNASGLASAGVPVSATGPGGSFSQTTDASGCAVFQVGAAGSYTVTLNTAGWVDQTGAQLSTKNSVVSAGQLARQEMTYDRAATITMNLRTTSGFSLPSPLPAVNYVKPNVPVASSRVIVASATTSTTVTGLWPDPGGYSAFSGSCKDSDPAGAPTGGTRGAPVVIAPGGSGSVDARMAPLDIRVTRLAGGNVGGARVIATSTALPCGADRVLDLGTTASNGKLQTSVPHGTWTLTISGVAGLTFPPELVTPSNTAVTSVDIEGL